MNILRKTSFTVVIILIFFLFTFGIEIFFRGKTLHSFDGSPWLDYGAPRWGNDSVAKMMHDIIFLDGEFPIWNRFSGVGQPFFPDPHNSYFSPFSFFLYLFPFTATWDFILLGRLFILIFSMYLLLSQLKIHPFLAIAASLLFGFSGHVFYFLNIVHLSSLVFVPAFILGIVFALKSQYRKALLYSTISFALMIFGGGFLDIVLLGLLSAFILFIAFIESIHYRTTIRFLNNLSLFTIFVIIGLVISFAFLIPFFELRTVSLPPYSGRSNTVFNDSLYFLGLFYSKLTVTPPNASNYYMDFRQYTHVLILPGFLFGIISLFFNRKNLPIYLGAFLFFLFYFFKLYDYSFIQFINNVPLLQDVRYEKYQGIFHFTIYLLGVKGYNEIWSRGRFFKKKIFIGISIVCILFPIYYLNQYGYKVVNNSAYKYYSAILFFLILVIVFSNLVYEKAINVNRKFLRIILISSLYFILFLFIFLQIRLDLNLKLAYSRSNFQKNPLMDTLKSFKDSRVFLFAGEGPKLVSAYRVNDVRNYGDFYTVRFNTFFKNHVDKYTCWHGQIVCSERPDLVNLSLLEFVGVKHIVLDISQIPLLLKNSYTDFKEVGRYLNFIIYELGKPLSFLKILDKVEIHSEDTVLSEIINFNSEERKEKLFLEKPVEYKETEEKLSYTIKNINWKNNSITADIETNKNAFLLLNSQFYPGWEAYINNSPVTILRANYLFQAIQVPAGIHKISFRYIPYSLLFGIAFSVVGIMILIFLYKFFSYRSMKF